MPGSNLFVILSDDLTAAVKAVGADVVTTVYFTGGCVYRQRRAAQGIV